MFSSLFLLLLYLRLFAKTLLFSGAMAQTVERRAQGIFDFITDNTGASPASRECASSINHIAINRYTGINPQNLSDPTYAVLWANLRVNNQKCQVSNLYTTATIFARPRVNVVTRGVASRRTWFLFGQDNSARKCGNFLAMLPARYFFTDDLPSFKDVLITQRYLPSNFTPEAVASAKKGDIFMMSQQYEPRARESVSSSIVCFYKLRTTPTPSPSMNPSSATGVSASQAPPFTRPDCFPGDARVQTKEGRVINMGELNLGEEVLVGKDEFSKVYAFSHKDENALTEFMVLNTRNASISLTSGHYVRVHGKGLVAARNVHEGDALVVAHQGSQEQLQHVLSVHKEFKKGLYAPHTLQGDIVVENIVASSYTEAVHPRVAHALLAPVRWTCWKLQLKFGARQWMLPVLRILSRFVGEYVSHDGLL